MHKVACSSFCWSVGAWTITKRQLSELRGVFARPAKQALRAPRYRGEGDEAYHRRLNRLPGQTMSTADVMAIDAYTLKRMYDYAGHLVRALDENPLHLTGLVLKYRDAESKATIAAEIGHQGHPGRFAPWNWERQLHSFFDQFGENWQQVACDKARWPSCRAQWVDFMGKRRALV